MQHSDPISGSTTRRRVFREFVLTERSYDAGTLLAPHSHSAAVLSFSIAGGTMVSLGQSTEWCDSNSVLYLPAGVKHANVYPQPSTRVHIEMASGNAMSSPCALRHPIVHELSRAAVSAFDEADNLSELDLTISINDAIGLLGSNRKTARSLRGDHWLLQLRDFLHAHCVEPLDMRMLSRVAGHHPVHVSREFRACFGKTITDYVRQRRILLAAKLLRCTSEPLSAIALDCGFYDQSHFANAFRRTAGVSPSAFRGCRGTGSHR